MKRMMSVSIKKNSNISCACHFHPVCLTGAWKTSRGKMRTIKTRLPFLCQNYLLNTKIAYFPNTIFQMDKIISCR